MLGKLCTNSSSRNITNNNTIVTLEREGRKTNNIKNCPHADYAGLKENNKIVYL